MSKIISFDREAKEKLQAGIDKVNKAVSVTMGPFGRNVLIEKEHGQVVSTKDGVTVAKTITLEDPIENMAATVIKQASSKTVDAAGDGTTTSTVLAHAIASQALEATSYASTNATQVKRGIEAAVKEVVAELKTMSVDITNEEQIKQIATLSANGDTEIGELVATAIDKVGRDGVVTVEESRSGETSLEVVEGLQFDRGYKSPYMVTDNNSMQAVLTDALVLLFDGKISAVKDLLPILERVSSENKSLLVVAEDIDGEALSTLIVNKMRGIMKVCAVKAPDFGDRRKLILEDIAITTGGQVFSKEKGMKLEKFSWEWFGEARTITIDKETTTIVDGKGRSESIEARIEELQQQINKAQTPYEIEKLQERLAKFVGGVAIIHVGGATETEMKELKDRVDDALHATKAAISEGIVPGGGAALWYAREAIISDTIGAKIVYKACSKPFEQILVNAGFSPMEAQMVGLQLDPSDTWIGYNIKEERCVNMKEAGIIDPTKVTRTALQNAASVAGTILLTECTIVDEPEEEKSSPIDPMMGMM